MKKRDMPIKCQKHNCVQHENSRRIVTSVSRIDSIPSRNCLPTVGVEALSGLVSMGVQKLIGNELYLKKGSGVCWIETDEEGLHLGPTSGKGFETVGNGLYLMMGCMMVEN